MLLFKGMEELNNIVEHAKQRHHIIGQYVVGRQGLVQDLNTKDEGMSDFLKNFYKSNYFWTCNFCGHLLGFCLWLWTSLIIMYLELFPNHSVGLNSIIFIPVHFLENNEMSFHWLLVFTTPRNVARTLVN